MLVLCMSCAFLYFPYRALDLQSDVLLLSGKTRERKRNNETKKKEKKKKTVEMVKSLLDKERE